MKKFLSVTVLLAFVTLGSFSQGFNSVFSPDGNFVIAVGDAGNCFMSGNGGSAFGSYPIAGGFNFNGVHGSGSKIIIVGDGGAIQVSTNGGASFTNNGVGGSNLNSVWVIDAITATTVGDGNGRIMRTTNGGALWTPQTSGVVYNLNGVRFTSANNGYACGDNGTVIYTTNGGTTWLSHNTGTTKNLLSIDVSGTTIIATAVDGAIVKYNGSVWSTIDYKSTVKPDVRSVSMIDASNFYTCGGGGFINKTIDGGVTRTYQQNPMQAPLSDIYFQSPAIGFAVASTNNAILRTIDAGATWNFQSGVSVTKTLVRKQNTSGNIGNPFCMHPKNKNGMFILAGSSLYRSLDKGETWTLLNGSVPGGSAHSFFVNTVDTNMMIASKGSSGGRVIGSTNYGTTWYDIINPINLTSYGMPLEVDPNNPNTVYLAPDNAPMRMSTNWGANWTILSGGEAGGTFRSPCDVIIQFDVPNVVIVGDGTTGSGSGKVWRSSNGGLNWTLINTVSGSEIPMMSNTSLDINLIYHTTWSSGSFWKSTTQASTFSNLNQSGSLWATDIAKDDPTAVAYDVYGTNTYLSLDAGGNFQTIPATSSPAAGVLFFDKANLLFQHGSGVDKMVITYNVTPVTGNIQVSTEIPRNFSLSQNYPNPFNPVTQIKYDIAKASNVSIKIFDVLGNEVALVVSGNLAAGKYVADFDASRLATGVYFYSLVVDGQKLDTKKMMLVK